jgi:3-keto-5-aminohexanoate cleavage enzyme
MNEPLLIVAALNGTRDRKVAKAVPYSADELAKEAKAAVDAGAGIVHVHARRDDGTPVFDLTFDDVLRAIRAAVDVPISISTQRQRQTSLGTITALFSVLSELPDLATVNLAPVAPDLPAHREEARQILEALDAAGVAPEPVVPSLEGLADLAALHDDGLLAHAPWMHFALGGRPAEAEHGLAGTPQNLLRLTEGLDGSASKLRWIGHGLGSASPAVCATAAAVGGWVRVGFEDTPLLPDGSVARSNAELVELAVALADALGREPVEPAEARRLIRRGEE